MRILCSDGEDFVFSILSQENEHWNDRLAYNPDLASTADLEADAKVCPTVRLRSPSMRDELTSCYVCGRRFFGSRLFDVRGREIWSFAVSRGVFNQMFVVCSRTNP